MIKLRLSQRSKAVNKQQTQAKTRSRTKVMLKPSVIAVYGSTFLLIVAMVFIGYHEPKNTSDVSNAVIVSSSSPIDQTSVDNVVATDVAATVAQAANLPIATSVANLATSAQAKSEFSQPDSFGTTKPRLIGSDTTSRSVISYTTKAGDTVDALATRYNISKETIKWANNLTTDALPVGTVLRILPVDGVLYSVKSGDTVDSIAAKYQVDKTRLVLVNDLDVSGLIQNTSIILPNAILPGNERPGYVAPYVATTTVTSNYNYYYAGTGTGFGGRTWNIGYGTPDDGNYSHGNCTLYASNRRKALGLPVGSDWGNAGSWAQGARNDGLVVNNSPSIGAVIQDWGHVAIVESILSNGDLSLSEMNAYVSGGGYNIVSGRIVPAGNVGQYLFIH